MAINQRKRMKNKKKEIQPNIAPTEVELLNHKTAELIAEDEKTASPSARTEEKPVSMVSFYQEGMKKVEKLTSHMFSREIARQQHIALPSSGNLFSCLNERAKGHYIELKEKGNLLSTLVEGIDGGELSTKVLIALIQVLNEQMNLKDSEEVKNTSSKIAGILGYQLHSTRNVGAVTNYEPQDKEGYPLSICPYVVIKISDFTRRVLSIPDTQKVRGTDKGRVRDTLDDLRIKEVFYKCANGHHRSVTLIRATTKDIDLKTKEEYRIIELDGVFIKNIQRDFVILPSDILTRLKGRQSTLTMRLFWFLVEQRSYKKPTYPVERKFKSELYDEVAIIDRYKDHPSDKDNDFKKAIEKMKEIRLISDYSECRDKNSGETTCVFTFRDDFPTVYKPS